MPRPGLLAASVDGCTVVHDPAIHTSWVLAPLVGAVWAALPVARDRVELARLVAARLGHVGDRIDAARAVDEACRSLVARGLAGAGEAMGAEVTAPGQVTAQGGGWIEPAALAEVGRWQVGLGRATVATDDAAAGDALRRTLAPLPGAGPDDDAHRIVVAAGGLGRGPGVDRLGVWSEGRLVGTAPDAAAAVAVVREELDRIVVAEAAEAGCLAFHAAAAETDGRSVAIVGPSGAGKSTLVAALVAAGWDYLTDEVVVLDPDDHRVRPYPRPIDLDTVSRAVLAGLPVDPPVARTGRSPLLAPGPPRTAPGGPLTLVVILGGLVGATAPADLVPLAPVAAVADLLDATFAACMVLPGALDQVARLAETVPCVVLPRLPAAASVALVHRALATARGPDDGTTTDPT